ncbi:MAG: RNA 2',3'-cyclic phosphodiesterase [Candidatus Omnitrophota bacterium]
MRAFIAIDLPQEVKNYLANLQTRLKTSGADVKWVEPQNIHLTLKFLGEIDEKTLHKIISILEDIAIEKNSYPINLSSLGAFPKINCPRILWVGINKGEKETKEIAKKLEETIEKIGIPAEPKPFSCHITIGRTRSMLNRDKLIENLKIQDNNLKKENLEFDVTKISLFKSTLTPKGPIYEVIKETELPKKPATKYYSGYNLENNIGI